MGDAFTQMFIVAIVASLLIFLFSVGLIRAILSIDKRIDLLKKIHKELELLNKKMPTRPSPKEIAEQKKREMEIKDRDMEIKTRHPKPVERPKEAVAVCQNCDAAILGKPLTFQHKTLCQKCNSLLRQQAIDGRV